MNKLFLFLFSLVIASYTPDCYSEKLIGTELFECLKEQYVDEAKVKQLIERGADINVRDEDASTILMTAAYFQHYSIVKLLIQSGVCLRAKDKWGRDGQWYARLGAVSLGVALGKNAKTAYNGTLILKEFKKDCCCVLCKH